jgi:hypothetical protein
MTQMRPALLLWDIMQCRAVILYVPQVQNYHSTLRNIPEVRRSHRNNMLLLFFFSSSSFFQRAHRQMLQMHHSPRLIVQPLNNMFACIYVCMCTCVCVCVYGEWGGGGGVGQLGFRGVQLSLAICDFLKLSHHCVNFNLPKSLWVPSVTITASCPSTVCCTSALFVTSP